MPMLIGVLLLGVPVAELATMIAVGRVLGVWPTLGLLLLLSLIGLWIVRHEGPRAWRAVRTAVGEGRVPGREAADGTLVLLGGLLLLLPGFLTAALGLLLVLPPTRALARGGLSRWAARRVAVVPVVGPSDGRQSGPAGGRDVVAGEVIVGEVVNDRPTRPRQPGAGADGR